VVTLENVVRIGDPEGAWGLIRVEQVPGSTRRYTQILQESVVGLYSVLNEEVVSHCFVANVSLEGQLLRAMDCGAAVEGLPHGTALDVRVACVPDLVVVDRVPAETADLPHVFELCVRYLGVGSLLEDDDVSSLFVGQ
jgi:hypothetical protein